MRGRLLAVDYGEKRIGLAISDPTGTIASPAGFIERRAGKRPPVAELIRRAEALELVLGERRDKGWRSGHVAAEPGPFFGRIHQSVTTTMIAVTSALRVATGSSTFQPKAISWS